MHARRCPPYPRYALSDEAQTAVAQWRGLVLGRGAGSSADPNANDATRTDATSQDECVDLTTCTACTKVRPVDRTMACTERPTVLYGLSLSLFLNIFEYYNIEYFICVPCVDLVPLTAACRPCAWCNTQSKCVPDFAGTCPTVQEHVSPATPYTCQGMTHVRPAPLYVQIY